MNASLHKLEIPAILRRFFSCFVVSHFMNSQPIFTKLDLFDSTFISKSYILSSGYTLKQIMPLQSVLLVIVSKFWLSIWSLSTEM